MVFGFVCFVFLLALVIAAAPVLERMEPEELRMNVQDRYAIYATKLAGELGNRCSVGFESGLRQTVRWYVEQENWWRDVTSGAYKAWIDKNYGFRIAV